MQFKYPEIFWALFLLLIPIIVHLIQLRRFRKTPFTNVRLLQKVTAQSSKTRTLKKWLLLISRLLLLAMLILAFSGPYLAEKDAGKSRETLIYLDNSFSMQLRATDRALLEDAIQELVATVPEAMEFTLFTNDQVFRKSRLKDIQNELLALRPTYKQLTLEEVLLKSKTLLEAPDEQAAQLIVLSDFQQRFMSDALPDIPEGLRARFVPLQTEGVDNIVLDTVYISNANPEQLELTARLQASVPDVESSPVSLYDGEQLIAKSAAMYGGKSSAEVVFTLPSGEITDGRIEITDPGLAYDNVLYFTFTGNRKIKVLVIGENENTYLNRIYTEEEFAYSTSRMDAVNYSELSSQNLVVLDELPTFSRALENGIRDFAENGGNVVIIPGEEIDVNVYNRMLGGLGLPALDTLIIGDLSITDIAYDHPLYRDVFEKQVSNFNYPSSSRHYITRGVFPYILGHQDRTPFLLGTSGRYLFTSPLSGSRETFKNTPLIVPTFYSMAWNSLQLPQLYQQLSGRTLTDIPWTAGGDEIVSLKSGTYEFIPLQKSYANKTTLTFLDDPNTAGNYTAVVGVQEVSHLSFNYPRAESQLTYTLPAASEVVEISESIPELFEILENEGRITDLWKWFVIFALFFALAEVLIQKLVK